MNLKNLISNIIKSSSNKSKMSTHNKKWIIAGLGNPGKKYEKTRHNAGFFIGQLCRSAFVRYPIDSVQVNSITNCLQFLACNLFVDYWKTIITGLTASNNSCKEEKYR